MECSNELSAHLAVQHTDVTLLSGEVIKPGLDSGLDSGLNSGIHAN